MMNKVVVFVVLGILLDSCLPAPTYKSDRCIQPVSHGTCKKHNIRYFYDWRVKRCKMFVYTGCGGNENNFATPVDCDRICRQIGTSR
nr:Tissue factor pathway inhibitor 2; partial [Biomphalaria glabrata]